MKKTHEKPNLDGVACVVDGRTGRVFPPGQYEKRQRDRENTRLSQRFVKGPIPVPWLAKAFSLTPSAAKCAIALFYQCGLSRCHEFKIEPARFRELGIEDTARRRGLSALGKAGLIEMGNRSGQSPVVTILTQPDL